MVDKDSIQEGKMRARVKLVEQTYLKYYKQRLDSGDTPGWCSEKFASIYATVSKPKEKPMGLRGVLVTVNLPDRDWSLHSRVVDTLFLDSVYQKVLTYKNFIPAEHGYGVEYFKKDQCTPTHTHSHLGFANIHGHSKTQYIQRVFAAMQQLIKKDPRFQDITIDRNSVDVVNSAPPETYITYASKQNHLSPPTH